MVVEVGQVASSGKPSGRLARSGRRRGSQVSRQWPDERVVDVLVDQGHQGPDRLLGGPGVAARTEDLEPRHCGHGVRHQSARERESNVGGDPVAHAGPGPEAVREALSQPALHAPRRYGDDLPRHRVRQRFEEYVPQGVDQVIGPRRPVEVQHMLKATSQM